jgi:hypothetical protein
MPAVPVISLFHRLARTPPSRNRNLRHIDRLGLFWTDIEPVTLLAPVRNWLLTQRFTESVNDSACIVNHFRVPL